MSTIIRSASLPPANHDAPPASDEIFLDHGCNTAAPRRVKASAAVSELRSIDAQQRAFAEQTAKEAARLEQERIAALLLQEEYQEMCAVRTRLRDQLARGRAEFEGSKRRMLELEAHCRWNWPGGKCAEHIAEFLQRQFWAARFPAWLTEWEKELSDLEKRIATFSAEHGIAAPD